MIGCQRRKIDDFQYSGVHEGNLSRFGKTDKSDQMIWPPHSISKSLEDILVALVKNGMDKRSLQVMLPYAGKES